MVGYEIVECGTPNGEDYRVYFKNENGPISPFHDIPLYADPVNESFNMVCEIPRWTNAKMVIGTMFPLNPILQEVHEDGTLRYVANCFPFKGHLWNYGAFPQTWENPSAFDLGDNNPIDVLEIGERVASRGEVIQVKVLGAVGILDDDITDWKIIAIDVSDPLASYLRDIEHIQHYFPGLLTATQKWFKVYKLPDGKQENKILFDGEAKSHDFASAVITVSHRYWKQLVMDEEDGGGIDCTNVTIEGSPFKITADEANEIVNSAPKLGPSLKIDSHIDKWHFVELIRRDSRVNTSTSLSRPFQRVED